MATNTLAGVNLTKISQVSLDVLKTEGIPLSAFTTDFTSDAFPKGETVTTRFATMPATQDFDSSKATGNSATTARSVTLDNYRGVSIGFKDTELTFTPVQLADLFVRPAISALVDYVINSTLTRVTNANGFTRVATVAPGAFDADSVADLAEGLSTGKVPKSPRHLILKPTYLASLAKDNSITAASDGPAGTDPLREHRLPRLHGFNVLEYNGTIPGNSENLVGLACGKQSLIIAARGLVEPPAGTWFGNIENIVDPGSGLPIQIREYYDGTELRYEFSVLFGHAIGIPLYATRIASA
jgi:hypothetical protein